MVLVTAIKPQKNKRRVNVYLDGKFGFGLDLQTYMKSRLKVEMELTDKEVGEIVRKGEFQSTYDKILRFAALRPRSRNEFEIWLRKYKVHQSLHSDLFKRLKRLELMGDEKFAFWWVGQRNDFKPKPKRVIVSELKQKGIKDEIIQKVLSETEIDEKSIAKKLLAKKERLWAGLPDFEKRKKMYTFLMQKGFDSSTIGSVLGEISDDLT